MTALNWISPATMQSLGWTLVHFLWQGTALAALAAAAMALCRRASARYLVGVTVLALMLIAPAATFWLLQQPHAVPAAARLAASASRVVTSGRHLRATPGSPLLTASPLSKRAGAPMPEAFPWLIYAWLSGVAFFSLRTAGGFLLLERQQRTQTIPVSDRVLEICVAMQRRLGLRRVVRFCQCQWLQAPAVIGWLRPVVLLPITTLTGLSEEQLRSVIAHELAHVQRLDAFVNVFQVCAEALLFYHPGVWWLNKRIRAEREHCCDDVAVSLCGNAVEYARALTLMEEWRYAPTLAMAANRGPLTERIVRLMGLKPAGSTAGRAGLTASIFCLGAALIAGNALVRIAYPKSTYAGSDRAEVAAVKPAIAASRPHAAVPASAPRAVAPRVAAPIALAPTEGTPSVAPSAAVIAQATPAAPAAASSPTAATPAQQAAPAQSYIEALKSAGLTNFDPDELIALKIQGVTPEYVREMKEAGLPLEVEDLVAMKVQGVTPEYVKLVRDLGFKVDQEELIAFKVQGVTPDYLKGLKEAGILPDINEVVALKVQGVTPAYVREIRAAGLAVDAEALVGLKVQGVTPEYVRGLSAQGMRPHVDDVVGMKVQGVSPEYIRDVRALGLTPSTDEIVGMKVQGITPEYIKALQAAGLTFDVDELIGAKVQGITPEFIERVRKHGFQKLTLDKLIQLKHAGVLGDGGEI